MNDTTKIRPRQPAGAFVERDHVMPGTVWHGIGPGAVVLRARLLHVTTDREFVVLREIDAQNREIGVPRPLRFEELQPAWRMQSPGTRVHGETYQLRREDPNAAFTRETADLVAVDTSFGRVPTWLTRPQSTVVAVLPWVGRDLPRPGDRVYWTDAGRAVPESMKATAPHCGILDEIAADCWLIVRQIDAAAQEVVP